MTVNFLLATQPVEVKEVEVIGGRKSEIAEISASTHALCQANQKQVLTVGQSDLFRSIHILPGIVSAAVPAIRI